MKIDFYNGNRIIEQVSRMWDNQYPPDKFPNDINYQEKLKIGDRLRELLKSKVLKNEIDKIIGNGSWTQLLTCNNCNTEILQVVEFTTYDDNIALCKNCVQYALSLFPE